MAEHWLLYTTDREHGGHCTVGIFASEDAAWEHYWKKPTRMTDIGMCRISNDGKKLS